MKWSILIFICSMVSVMAEKPWPKQVAEPTFAETATTALPQELQKALLGYDAFRQGKEELPDVLQICRANLNIDGSADFIVEVPDGFSGGPEVDIFELREGKYVEIGFEQGLCYFGPRVNGYYQLICQSRGGAGASVRVLLQFRNGRYRVVRMTDYQMRKMGGVLDFVRERSPKEFESQ